MATIEKRERKNGVVYKAVVRIKGLPPQRRSFKRITDAKLWVQQTEAAIRKVTSRTWCRPPPGRPWLT